MKNFFLATVFVLSFASSMLSLANTRLQEGFIGKKEGIYTVETAVDAGFFSDGMEVRFDGYITTSLGNELYSFEDKTGSIIVEIRDDKWFGLLITAETKITIRGTINYEFHEKTIMVDSVRLSQ